MTIAIPETHTSELLTAEDFSSLSDSKGYELEDGRLVEKNAGCESGWIGGEIFALIRSFVKCEGLGWASPAEVAHRCFPRQPNHIRKPDASFIRFGRLPGEQLPKGCVTLPPDLVVEVLSPNDLASDVERKVREYLDAGVRLVWVVNPDVRTLRAHRADKSVSDYLEQDIVSGEDVLPGFTFKVIDLFPRARETTGK